MAKSGCKHCKKGVETSKGIKPPAGFFCSHECATKWGQAERDRQRLKKARDAEGKLKKKYAKQKREFKLNDRTLRDKEAQKAFNAYIRLRDKDDPCISCGRHHEGQYHAGHYKTRGAHPELRFEELNCHKQCSACNNHLSGNIANYRPNLINKIGVDKLDWLEGPHDVIKYSCEELKEIELKYKAMKKELDNE